MAYDLLFKNVKRNWARVGDDLNGVMSPTSGWSLFKAARKGMSAVTHVATKAVSVPFSIASKSYQAVTPKKLKSILRWTPGGLAIRAGVKLAPGVKAGLSKVVKWSPYGMAFRGTEYALTKSTSSSGSCESDPCGSLGRDEYEIAMDGGSSERDALVRQLGWNPF